MMRSTLLVLILFSLSACSNSTPPDPVKSQNLFAAIKSGETENVRTIARSDPRLARTLDPTRATPVLSALYHEKPEVAKALVESGFELTMPEAAAYGDRQAVARLLKPGKSSVNTYSDDGFGHMSANSSFLWVDPKTQLIVVTCANDRQLRGDALKTDLAAVLKENLIESDDTTSAGRAPATP